MKNLLLLSLTALMATTAAHAVTISVSETTGPNIVNQLADCGLAGGTGYSSCAIDIGQLGLVNTVVIPGHVTVPGVGVAPGNGGDYLAVGGTGEAGLVSLLFDPGALEGALGFTYDIGTLDSGYFDGRSNWFTINGFTYGGPTLFPYITPGNTLRDLQVTVAFDGLQPQMVVWSADGPSQEINNFRLEYGAGGVPEPSTWAMLLVGFAMMAFGPMFRRRLAVVSKWPPV